MERHLDEMVLQNVLGYAKLFDARRIDPKYADHDMLMLGARLSVYNATMESGPLAVFGTGDTLRRVFASFANVTSSRRPPRLFRTESAARRWLAEATIPPRRPRGRPRKYPVS